MANENADQFVEKLMTSQVVAVDRTSCNVWKYTFLDGEVFEVWAEAERGLPFMYVEKGESA